MSLFKRLNKHLSITNVEEEILKYIARVSFVFDAPIQWPLQKELLTRLAPRCYKDNTVMLLVHTASLQEEELPRLAKEFYRTQPTRMSEAIRDFLTDYNRMDVFTLSHAAMMIYQLDVYIDNIRVYSLTHRGIDKGSIQFKSVIYLIRDLQTSKVRISLKPRKGSAPMTTRRPSWSLLMLK